MSSPAPPLDVRPIGARFGAEILGLDLDLNLTPTDLKGIRAALLKHQVIIFRDQRLDDADHVALLSRFGTLTGVGGSQAGLAGRWHGDATFVVTPPQITSLRAPATTSAGATTSFASTTGAYRDLPDPLRTVADSVWAVHSKSSASGPDHGEGPSPDTAPRGPETAHPVVRVHPETGERGLLIGGFARRLIGHPTTQSRDLLDVLQRQVTHPANVVRWEWAAGDLILIDNRVTQHCHPQRAADVESLHRIAVVGDAPLGVNGQHSYSLAGRTTQRTPNAA